MTASARTRLLIVDDSAVMRRLLRETFERETAFEIETARDGAEALARAASFRPDVMTLDVAMPGMDGLAVLRALPSHHACPVVMVSSLTAEGARLTLEALSLGAMDFIAKPSALAGADLAAIRAQLVAKVRVAARMRRHAPSAAVNLPPRPTPAHPARPITSDPTPVDAGVVLIGVSTGGPRALERILPHLPGDFPWPVVVAQHMPAAFTGVLAQRLASRASLCVLEAAEPVPLRPGTAIIAAGDHDLVLARDADRIVARPVPVDASPWHPSADRLVRSAIACLPPERLIGVLLTGMGDDGADAMAALHRLGGRTIAEAESSAVVFGMPGALIRRGGATLVLPVEQVPAALLDWVRTAGPAPLRVAARGSSV